MISGKNEEWRFYVLAPVSWETSVLIEIEVSADGNITCLRFRRKQRMFLEM